MATRLVEAGYRAVAVDLPAHGSSPGTTTDLFELREAVVATGAAAGPLAGIVSHSRGSVDVWRRLDAIDTGPRVASDALVIHDVDDRDVQVGEGVRVARALGTEAVLTTGLGHGRILADEDVATRVVEHLTA